MDSIRLKLCDIQGHLLERSTAYANEGFIRDFLNSKVAEHLDPPYNIRDDNCRQGRIHGANETGNG